MYIILILPYPSCRYKYETGSELRNSALLHVVQFVYVCVCMAFSHLFSETNFILLATLDPAWRMTNNNDTTTTIIAV